MCQAVSVSTLPILVLAVHKFGEGIDIKTAVDIRHQILAGGGEMHSNCETVLLDNRTQQQDVWGASWNPISQEIFYESMVNLRPRQNRAMEILDPAIREQVKQIIHKLLGGL
ncbi:DUF5674 family protein [Brunnivagina elsteri]|uniref:DUF5674 family protein n=1 Tax=Brunnivagina elsteri TaxID=1247191 RepID=UPI003182D2CF